LLKRVVRSGIAVALGAASLIGALPGVAHAECFYSDWPPQVDVAAYRGHLFRGTVTHVDPATETRSDWYATLRVEHQYRGSVADPLQLHGWSGVGCSHLDGSKLSVGDMLMVSIDRMNPSLYGPLLVWEGFKEGASDVEWRLYDPVLRGSNADYPRAAQGRLSTADILALVGPGTLPETDAATVPSPGPETVPAAALAVSVGIVTVLVAIGMPRRLRRPI
jgi:hypothetical protein